MGIFDMWYTDKADIYRTVATIVDGITRNTRTLILQGLPCRAYQNNKPSLSRTETSAVVTRYQSLACALGADVQKGDEIIVTRGAGVGRQGVPMRYFAGEPRELYEPFGGAYPRLAHLEISLDGEERVTGAQ